MKKNNDGEGGIACKANLVISFGRERFSFLQVTLSCTRDCQLHTFQQKGIYQIQDSQTL
jgi:hypothetical protein